jgi:hypothetical protein
MMMALMALLGVVGLGLYLSGTLGGIAEGDYYAKVKTLHYSFGLWGWISLLIIAISFQTIEMFYVTPPHPTWMRKGLGWGILTLLVLSPFGSLLWAGFSPLIETLLALLLIGYAGTTFYRLTQRKRPLADATIWFWRMGLISLVVSMLLVVLCLSLAWPALSMLRSVAFASFAISILFAMLYKIIPFLTWFHLNSEGYLTAPMMHEVIHPKTAKKHLYIHLAAIGLLLLAPFVPLVVHVGGLMMAVSFGWLLYQIVHAMTLYRSTQAHGEKFDLNPPLS